MFGGRSEIDTIGWPRLVVGMVGVACGHDPILRLGVLEGIIGLSDCAITHVDRSTLSFYLVLSRLPNQGPSVGQNDQTMVNVPLGVDTWDEADEYDPSLCARTRLWASPDGLDGRAVVLSCSASRPRSDKMGAHRLDKEKVPTYQYGVVWVSSIRYMVDRRFTRLATSSSSSSRTIVMSLETVCEEFGTLE